ncbi:RNA polymerase III subunit C17 [Cooperia oncophora]
MFWSLVTILLPLIQTTKYLKATPAADQSVEAIEKLIRDVAPFKLTAAETMQLINLRPSTTTEVQLLIEESEERLKTEEKLESLVNIVVDCLPSRPTSSMAQ